MSIRIIVCTLVVLIGTFVNIEQVNAQAISQANSRANGLAIALKGGIPRIDLNLGIAGANTGADEDTAFGLTIGYQISNNSTIELEFVRGTAEFNASDSVVSLSSDVEVNTIGLYYTQRTDGQLYFVFKSGIVREDVIFSDSSSPDTTSDNIGFSWGLGGGYQFNPDLSVEAEYVQIESDVAWVLLSARYEFSL